jgi:bifunctional non-homologous end joining protein LigD
LPIFPGCINQRSSPAFRPKRQRSLTARSGSTKIKHDGYRLIVQRDGQRVRLFTRNGHDWSDRFPLIAEAALRNRNTSFVIDGEAVLLGVDGRSDFSGLHSRTHNQEVEFYAFDILPL